MKKLLAAALTIAILAAAATPAFATTVFGDTAFRPALTRGQAVAVLYKAARADGIESSFIVKNSEEIQYPFADVGSSNELNAIFWASSNGIINGYPDGTFRPNQPISRDELAVLIAKFLGYESWATENGGYATYELDQFAAMDMAEWALPYFAHIADIVAATPYDHDTGDTAAYVAALIATGIEMGYPAHLIVL